MRTVAALPELAAHTDRRCLRLRHLVLTVDYRHPDLDRAASFVTIEAANIWANFCRSFYLSSASGGRRSDGSRVQVTVAPGRLTVPEALRHANAYKRTPAKGGKTRAQTKLPAAKARWSVIDEPSWHRPHHFRGALKFIGASNLPVVTASMAAEAASMERLYDVRNFFAHRSESSAEKVKPVALAYGLPMDLHPRQLVFAVLPRRPQPLIADWLDDMRTLAAMMCEI
jgi:hypothetical protein